MGDSVGGFVGDTIGSIIAPVKDIFTGNFEALPGDIFNNAISAVTNFALPGAGLGLGFLGDAALGAGLGAATSAITGGDPLKGALSGGITGGVGSFGPSIGEGLGIGSFGGNLLAGAGGGALGGFASGSDPGMGALIGAGSGALKGLTAKDKLQGAPSAGGSAGGPAGGAAANVAPGAAASPGGLLSDFDKILSGSSSLPVPGAGSAGSDSSSGGGLLSDFSKTVSSNSSVPVPGASSGGGGITDFLGKNASWLVPAAGLGYQAIKGQSPMPGEKQINTAADQLGKQGQQLSGYLQSGTLPPGVQQSINQGVESAKASIRSKYASMGMSGSSAEMQEISSAEMRGKTEGANIAMNLLQTGISESGLAAGLYQDIMKNALDQDKELGSALSTFGSSLGGGTGAGKNVTLSVA